TEAIEEALTVAKAANIPLEISHFKVGGQQNWGRSKQTLAMVMQARDQGLEVTIDQYPYTASSTSLSTLLPDWVLADNDDSLKARLHTPETRKQVIEYMLQKCNNEKLNNSNNPLLDYIKQKTQ